MVDNAERIGEETRVTILFADVVGSTQLYENMGDERARETVQDCVDIMKESTDQYGGRVIKTMGDEVMSTFPSADDAMNAGSQMQQRITNNQQLGEDGTQVSIRIGCHYGPVVFDNRDIFGAAISTANRMTSQAKAGQIITTSTTVDQLSGEWKSLVRQIDIERFGSQSGDVAIFEVLWQPDEATRMSLQPRDLINAGSESDLKLYVSFRGKEVVIGESCQGNMTMGRAEENDIIVKGQLISRIHARIEYVKNRFFIIDESTNGTFVQGDDGKEAYIRRDRSEISGSGTIGLGKAVARDSDLAVEYRFESCVVGP
jgi:adenylate cyclase